MKLTAGGKAIQAAELMSWLASIFKHKTAFNGLKIHFICWAACSCFLKYTRRTSDHLLCADRQMRHCLWLASENTLTAAATLAVGLPSRQQHLQAVPKHDCSRCPGLDYRKNLLGKEERININVSGSTWSVTNCLLWDLTDTVNDEIQELNALLDISEQHNKQACQSQGRKKSLCWDSEILFMMWMCNVMLVQESAQNTRGCQLTSTFYKKWY